MTELNASSFSVARITYLSPEELMARSLAAEKLFHEEPDKGKMKNKSHPTIPKLGKIPTCENCNKTTREIEKKGKCGQNTQTASHRSTNINRKAIREQIQVELEELDKNATEKNAHATFQELENLKKRERRLFWLSPTLSEYLRSKRIPRGMRLIPNGLKRLPTHSKLADAIHSVSDKGSFDLMLLSIKHAAKSRDALLPKISALEETLKKRVPKEIYGQLKHKMDVKIDVFENTLKKILEKKCKRDGSDYLADKIYTWKYRKETGDSSDDGSSFCYSTSDSDDYSNHDHSNSSARISSTASHVTKAKSRKARRGRKGKNQSKSVPGSQEDPTSNRRAVGDYSDA